MRKDTRDKFLLLGFDTELIKKLEDKDLTLSAIRGINNPALLKMGFTIDEATLIVEKTKRQIILPEVLQNILVKSGEVCCYCADGNSSRPFQIHHIEAYYKTQDNSEENLMLVCPTHHVAIHKNNIAPEDQKAKKNGWENINLIAHEYQVRGIAFPFGAFEKIDYSCKGSITEIFSFGSPKGSVCIQLLQESVITDTKHILEKENKLILSGASGSGKTTLAKGIAGVIEDHVVFSYTAGNNASGAAAEALLFLSVAVKPIVLLLDNANTKLEDEYIEKILNAAAPNKKIIIVTTNNHLSSANDIEQHFLKSVYPITWNLLKGGIRKSLLDNEYEVIKYLNENGLNNGTGFLIGSGRLNKQLSNVIDSYMDSVKTVWQFIFLLASGDERIDIIQTKFYSNDRIDLVVLFIGINQIAQVESGTSIKSILELYRQHSALSNKPVPEVTWLKEILNNLINERIIKEDRGRYNTVHRQFALNFIDHCYFKLLSDSKELLKPIFSDPNRIQEIVILWTWLMESTARDYVHEWLRSLDPEKWKALVTAAGNKSLRVISLLADLLFGISFNGYRPLKESFPGKANTIASLINKNEEYTLNYLRRLFLPLKRDCPELIKEVMDKVEHSLIAEMVKNTEPELFEDIDWLFSTLVEVYPEWVNRFSDFLSKDDFIRIINKIQQGDIDALCGVVSFQRRYIENIRISQYKIYLQRFSEFLKNCGLEDIKYFTPHREFQEIFIYPDELLRILNALDGKRLAEDFSKCSARHWGNLLSLSLLSRYIKTDVISGIIENIDTESLGVNISRYNDQYPHELRVLIYQLCYGNRTKREELSTMLKPFVESILKASKENDVQDVLKAYCTLDLKMGQILCDELGKQTPPDTQTDDIFAIDYRESTENKLDKFKEYIEQVREKERSGEDYLLDETKFQISQTS